MIDKTICAVALTALALLTTACSNPMAPGAVQTSHTTGAGASDASDSSSATALPAPGRAIPFPAVPVTRPPADAIRPVEVKNGGFEKGELDAPPEDWTCQVPNGTCTRTDDRHAEGSASLKISADKPGTWRIVQSLALTGHHQYLLRCNMLAPDEGGMGQINLVDGTDPSRFGSGSKPANGGKDAWQLLETRIELPANVAEPTFVLRYTAKQGPARVWFDGCEIYDLGPRVTNNLVENSNLVYTNANVQGWRPIQTYEMASDSTNLGPEIPRALRISTPPSGPIRLDQTVTGLTPGKSYIARAYIKTENLDGAARLEVHGPTQEQKGDGAVAVSGTTDWTWTQSEFVAGQNMNSVRLQLVCRPRGDAWSNPGKVWFAKVELFGP